jgi:hypothetical protein
VEPTGVAPSGCWAAGTDAERATTRSPAGIGLGGSGTLAASVSGGVEDAGPPPDVWVGGGTGNVGGVDGTGRSVAVGLPSPPRLGAVVGPGPEAVEVVARWTGTVNGVIEGAAADAGGAASGAGDEPLATPIGDALAPSVADWPATACSTAALPESG